MGYGVYIGEYNPKSKQVEEIEETWQYLTFNLSPMMRAAFGNVGSDWDKIIDNRNDFRSDDVKDVFMDVLKELIYGYDTYKIMEPENGFGNVKTAMEFLVDMIIWADRYPDGYLVVHK